MMTLIFMFCSLLRSKHYLRNLRQIKEIKVLRR